MSVVPVVVRRAHRSELDALPRVQLAANQLIPSADLPWHLRYCVTERGDLLDAQQKGRLWVAVDEAMLVIGFAMAAIVDGEAHLDEVNVMPDYGGRGIGARLLNAVKAWARRQGYAGLTLVTFRHLPWNAPFYTNQGFAYLDSKELGDDLKGLMEAEKRIGINGQDRVAMRVAF